MGLWHRIYAASYDTFSGIGERKGLADERRALLAQAKGRALEIGAGTGANVQHYPEGVDLVLTEPDPLMAKRLRRRAGTASVVLTGAEALPFEDGSFDTVVATLVFCSVPDVGAALREVRRVLAPGGRLIFLEHVRGEPGSKLARWQDRLQRPWRAFAVGCNCNRDFLSALATESFEITGVRHEAWPSLPPLVRPVVIGTAVAS